MSLGKKIQSMQGPILILGSSGFVGANLFRMFFSYRDDVFGTDISLPSWRLEGMPENRIIQADLMDENILANLIQKIRPQTVMDCIAYGAYSFENDYERIYQTNFILTAKLLKQLENNRITCYVHAGSSSEYGDNVAGTSEEATLAPNSHYSVSKIACANLIYYYGKKRKLPCVNLRLYSVYGPWEDSSRLIPSVINKGFMGKYPDFVDPSISRDFVYVEDVCEAFIYAALNLSPENYGESFNVGTGHMTSIREVAELSRRIFHIDKQPTFNMPQRSWDLEEWFADTRKTKEILGWQAKTELSAGIRLTMEWFNRLEDKEQYLKYSKKNNSTTSRSISAVIACYKDGQAIPIMYKRLTDTFLKLGIDYEIIFVNDNSPDDSENIILQLSKADPHVIGISHSRNFGSQAAFKSGMEIATKDACVLLDGDLQDPPELITEFYDLWIEGYDVVFGRRIKREAPLGMQLAYKLFYRVFDYFSYIAVPRDAGDFSLIDKRVMQHMLSFPERDLFLRGVRAFAGFKQIGVDYIRPERMFGESTNNLIKNIGWAKKGILSFTNTPLNILSFIGMLMFVLSVLLGIVQILSKFLWPTLAPKGITTIMLIILFFGSINLLAIGLVGEYIAKILEEVKQRPHFIRRNFIVNGELRDAYIGREWFN